MEVKTCPNCGALISPQLARCRQCNQYLHGTAAEAFLFEQLLPARFQSSPGTALITLVLVFYYALMVVMSAFDSPLSFSRFSLIQLGAAHSASILLGDYWRIVTSWLLHHDAVHLAFNLWALSAAGPLVEEAFDRKKMLVAFIVAGTLSMAASVTWALLIKHSIVHVTGGASGAVSGLIGAALVAAHRMGPDGRTVKQFMIRWTIYLALFGLLVSGIDNVAHASGYLVGAIFAFFFPLGATQSQFGHKTLSSLLVLLLGVTVMSVVMMIGNARGFPTYLDRDENPKSILFFQLSPGHDREYSSQTMLAQACGEAVNEPKNLDKALHACKLAMRAADNRLLPYIGYGALLEISGKQRQVDKIDRLLRIAGWPTLEDLKRQRE